MPDSSDEPEVILQQMEDTRSALSDKLQTLESQVVGTVSEANTAVVDTVETVKEAVQETVATVKDTVQETVDTVKETFDLSLQMDRHPWVMVGGSIALGYVGGRLLESASPPRATYYGDQPALPPLRAGRAERMAVRQEEAARHEPRQRERGWSSVLAEQFAPEISRLKSMALGAMMALARDAVVPSLPDEVKPRIEEVMNNITTKLGGEVFQKPLLAQDPCATPRKPDYLSTLGGRRVSYG